jgi:hypothetical protein
MKVSGFVQKAIERANLSGVVVSPPEPRPPGKPSAETFLLAKAGSLRAAVNGAISWTSPLAPFV